MTGDSLRIPNLYVLGDDGRPVEPRQYTRPEFADTDLRWTLSVLTAGVPARIQVSRTEPGHGSMATTFDVTADDLGDTELNHEADDLLQHLGGHLAGAAHDAMADATAIQDRTWQELLLHGLVCAADGGQLFFQVHDVLVDCQRWLTDPQVTELANQLFIPRVPAAWGDYTAARIADLVQRQVVGSVVCRPTVPATYQDEQGVDRPLMFVFRKEHAVSTAEQAGLDGLVLDWKTYGQAPPVLWLGRDRATKTLIGSVRIDYDYTAEAPGTWSARAVRVDQDAPNKIRNMDPPGEPVIGRLLELGSDLAAVYAAAPALVAEADALLAGEGRV